MSELNREQIIKALECFHHRILNTKLAEKITESEMMAVIDALSLIKELTQANEMLSESYDHLEKTKDELLSERARLTEENERLRADNLTFAHGVEKVAANYYNLGCADTVRKMQERLKAAAYKEIRLYGKMQKVHIGVDADTIDQIAKEMTKGGELK